jgi:hypothetical protein
MSPSESCQAAESGLQTVQKLLLEPRPDTFEQCLQALSQVIEILENLAAGSSRDWDPAVHLAFHRIRKTAGNLNLQIGHGSNLVRGWMQLRFGAGYTRRGLPEFPEREAERLFEA